MSGEDYRHMQHGENNGDELNNWKDPPEKTCYPDKQESQPSKSNDLLFSLPHQEIVLNSMEKLQKYPRENGFERI